MLGSDLQKISRRRRQNEKKSSLDSYWFLTFYFGYSILFVTPEFIFRICRGARAITGAVLIMLSGSGIWMAYHEGEKPTPVVKEIKEKQDGSVGVFSRKPFSDKKNQTTESRFNREKEEKLSFEGSFTEASEPFNAEQIPSEEMSADNDVQDVENEAIESQAAGEYDEMIARQIVGEVIGTFVVSPRMEGVFGKAVFPATLPASGADAAQVTLSGELKTWHCVTLTFQGPETSETADPNPFTDYRLTVTFTHPESGATLVVPGYFAADGKAADTSAESGNVWHAHLAPPKAGRWTYVVSLRTGKDVAISDDPQAGKSAGFFDGLTGQFAIEPSDKTGRDHRAKGLLEYVGKHHLRFAGSGEWFLKAGVDAPENLLAYDDFDGTPNVKNRRKSWRAHARDFDPADAGAYTWAGGKGTELLGAIKYLHDKGLNAFSFLTFSLDGDDDNVFPHRLVKDAAAYEALPDNRRWKGGVYHDRFDVSKLDQWERIFAYADKLGMFLHFKTMETENELKMDGGDLGRERKLYYRELVARFSHHLALNWNLGEEINDATTAQKQAWAVYLHNIDPYKHHKVIHNGAPHYDLLGPCEPEKGTGSELTGFSLQTNRPNFVNVFPKTLDYLRRSDAAGKPWVVACDEPGDAGHALRPAGDEGDSWEDARKNALWGNLMAGGTGVEFYFGHRHAHSDLTCQDWRSRDGFWDYCRYALEFFKNNDVPFQDMANHNELVSNGAWCLAKPGEVYVVYLRHGGTASLNLSGTEGTFTVRWYDPRNGGELQKGSVETVQTGRKVPLGKAPRARESDWVVLIRR